MLRCALARFTNRHISVFRCVFHMDWKEIVSVDQMR